MVTTNNNSYSKRLLQLISWSHWFTFFNVIAAIIIATIYIKAEPFPESAIGITYLIVTWFTHMAFLVFVGFLLTVFPITLLLPKTRFIRTFASIIFTIALGLLLFDGYVYLQLGYHLNASSSEQIINLLVTRYHTNGSIFIASCILIGTAILAFQLVVSNYAWKHLKQLQKTSFAKYTVFAFVGGFFISHLGHIAADADLNYDILRQDTLFPLSYPSTAKTLLTKYGLINQDDYIKRKNKPLAFAEQAPTYPTLPLTCQNAELSNTIIMVLTDKTISERQFNQFSRQANNNVTTLGRHVDNANADDAWFNLLYGLPSLYKEQILSQQKAPLLFQYLAQHNLKAAITVVHDSKNTAVPENILPSWLTNLMSDVHYASSISPLLINIEHQTESPKVQIFYFSGASEYQLEIFVDALLLNQRTKPTQDILWVSSLGNTNNNSAFGVKPSVLIWPDKPNKSLSYLTSQMDLQPTLISEALGCSISEVTYSTGKNLFKVKKDRIIANSMVNGLMVFNKDKTIFIDQNGNFQSYSIQLQTPIIEKADFPLLIDGVKYIKRYGSETLNEQ